MSRQANSIGTMGYATGTASSMGSRGYILDPLAATTTTDPELVTRIYDIISRLGKYVTFTIPGSKVYDPLTGGVTPGEPSTETLKVTPPYPVSHKMIDGDTVLKGDATCYLPKSGLSWVPKCGWQVSIDSVLWKITKLNKIYTFTAVGLYELILRRFGKSTRTASNYTTTLDESLVPAILAIINDKGIDATFTVTSGESYAPGSGGVSGGSDTEYSKKIIKTEYDAYFIDGDLIKQGDIKIYVAASGLGFDPEPGTKVTIDSIDWKIVDERPIYTGELIGLFELQLRR